MEITKSNFNDNFEDIKNNLKNSSFVGFDAEFTALLSSDVFHHRLFDKSEDRYNKIKTEVSKMIMTQVGLTMFQYNRERDKYIAMGYTFHLCPQSFGDIDQTFIFQASTIKFLCRHKFDFNKFTYEGLPYLSKKEEKTIQAHLRDNSLFTDIARNLEFEDEKFVQHHCSEVSKWLSQSEEGTMYIDVKDPILRYIIHMELRLRFLDILTTNSLGNSNKVLIYRNKSIDGAVSLQETELEENLMNHLLGFSRIIKLLEEFKKPIVGHNIYMDLILMHNQFIGPLPKSYAEYKRNIHQVFPTVYDTKFISFEMARKLTMDEVWKSNALQDLYEFFHEHKCKKLNIGGVNGITPVMMFSSRQSYHEAGWDSYCTGYCFIRMGHWAANENSGVNKTVTPTELLTVLSRYSNKVNLIRGAIPYMNLSGEDPSSHRPKLMYMHTLKGDTINVVQVAAMLANYGSIDVKPYGRRAALVVAGSQKTADKILKQFNSKNFRVTLYSPYRHSLAGRMAMWSGALIAGSLMLYLLHKKIKRQRRAAGRRPPPTGKC